MTSFWINNVRIVAEQGVIERGAVQVDAGRVAALLNEPAPQASAEPTVDGQGLWLIPGMIDVHIHGANGRDMMDGTTTSIEEVSRACAATGCTSFLVTSVSSTLDDLLAMIGCVKAVVGREPGARIAGIHVEGPYLN